MLYILGYLSSILMGLSLGMVGAGGAILVVPILVYLFGVAPAEATTSSLFIVGTVACVGAFQAIRNRQVKLLATIWFAVPSFVGVYLVRALVLPYIPETLLQIGNFGLTKGTFLMGLFALLMVTAALSMLRNGVSKRSVGSHAVEKSEGPKKILISGQNLLTIFVGFGVGSLTSLIGAGGGFLIIPALVVLLGLTMKQAAGTSLILIMANSYFGFLVSYLGKDFSTNWSLNFAIITIAIFGLAIGKTWADKINEYSLKRGFAFFVLIMGALILADQIL